MKLLLVFTFYGLFYLFFENVFNWVQMDLLNKSKSWREKLTLRPSNPASLWHFLSGAVGGLLLYLLFLIPFNMTNVFHIIIGCIVGGVIITSIELGYGYLLFYIIKIERFWDYRNTKLNYLGLIDIWHGLSWVGLTYAFYWINKLFFG